MQYFQDISSFIAENSKELRSMTNSICMNYSIHTVDDVLQDVYKSIIKRDALTKYDPNHPSAAKISTYLYSLAKDVVRTEKKNGASIIERHKWHKFSGGFESSIDESNFDDVDSLPDNYIDVNYSSSFTSNTVSDSVDGINLDLNLFEVYLQKKDKIYSLNRRVNKEIEAKTFSLLVVFKLMREGFSNKSIAKMFGVTDMFISTIKEEIKEQMVKFGLYSNECTRKSTKKEFMTEDEVKDYLEEILQECDPVD